MSNIMTNTTHSMTLPANVVAKEAIISASLLSLYGNGNGPQLSNYGLKVSIGALTSNNYVSSTQEVAV
jgi:hypothetical protein